jgi:hypothetical protein
MLMAGAYTATTANSHYTAPHLVRFDLTTSLQYVLVSFVNTAPHLQHFVSSNHPVPRNLSERLALIVLLMGNAIAAGAPRTPVTIPIINLVRSYLNRLVRRVAALARRVEAGTAAIRPRPPARPDAAPRDRPAADPRRPAMPRGVGWLYRLVPFVAANRSQLRFFLAGEEEAELAAVGGHERHQAVQPADAAGHGRSSRVGGGPVAGGCVRPGGRAGPDGGGAGLDPPGEGGDAPDQPVEVGADEVDDGDGDRGAWGAGGDGVAHQQHDQRQPLGEVPRDGVIAGDEMLQMGRGVHERNKNILQRCCQVKTNKVRRGVV